MIMIATTIVIMIIRRRARMISPRVTRARWRAARSRVRPADHHDRCQEHLPRPECREVVTVGKVPEVYLNYTLVCLPQTV